ncbi:MAG: hypothetical protein ACSHXF_16365 [Aquaticitalea sp.]
MLIQSLYTKNKITARGYKVCVQNEIHTVKDLEKHYLEHGTFTNLANCSRLREEELKELIRTYYRPAVVEEIEERQENQHLLEMIAILNPKKHKALQSAIMNETRMLSNKSQKQIRQLLASNLTPENVVKSLFLPQIIELTQLEGLKEKHHTEIKNYLKNVKSLITT